MLVKIAVGTIIGAVVFSFVGGCRKEGQRGEDAPSHRDAAGHVEAGPQVGEQAPVFSLNDLEGKKVDVATIIGKKTLTLVFWGTWCGVCKQEIPVLKKMQSAYGDRGFQIISVAVKETPNQPDAEFRKDVTDFTKAERLNFTVLLDPEYQAVALYQLHGVPTIIVVDLKGTARYTGHSAHDAEAIVKRLLAG
jgi:peroxiredoxin